MLFRHFQQTSAGQKAGSGTGLGLAISREFMRLVGGDITIDSQIGKGSIFVIDMPVKEGEAHAVQLQAPGHVLTLRPGQPECRVLIVDDMLENRELLSQILRPVGFEIRLAHDGEQAVKEFEQWRPDLILMDLRMPVMEGQEAIQKIRGCADGQETKIIIVSASVVDENRHQLLGIGADDFIGKPFRAAELFEKIHIHLGVEYVYGQPPAVVADAPMFAPGSLAGLPKDLIYRLREAIIRADLDKLLDEIHEVEAHTPSLALELRRVAEHFEYQQLLDSFGPPEIEEGSLCRVERLP